jgi:hypothetical protein
MIAQSLGLAAVDSTSSTTTKPTATATTPSPSLNTNGASSAFPVIITELMANSGNFTGSSPLIDQFGDDSDWIELYNTHSSQTVSLQGWSLTTRFFLLKLCDVKISLFDVLSDSSSWLYETESFFILSHNFSVPNSLVNGSFLLASRCVRNPI